MNMLYRYLDHIGASLELGDNYPVWQVINHPPVNALMN